MSLRARRRFVTPAFTAQFEHSRTGGYVANTWSAAANCSREATGMRRRSTFVAVTAAGLLLTGCATKDWVRDMMGKAAADTDSKIGEQKIRVEGMGFRMAKVEEQATKAGERADAAHARAEAAHVRADGVDERLTRLWSSRHKRQDVESMDVTFGFDRWELDDGAQTTLLGFIKELQANPNLTVDLTGYTDPTGGVPYNIGLSQRRAGGGGPLPPSHAGGLAPPLAHGRRRLGDGWP